MLHFISPSIDKILILFNHFKDVDLMCVAMMRCFELKFELGSGRCVHCVYSVCVHAV